LGRLLGSVTLPWGRTLGLVGLGLLSCLPAVALWYFLREAPVLLQAPIVLLVFWSTYFATTRAAGLTELGSWLAGSNRDQG